MCSTFNTEYNKARLDEKAGLEETAKPLLQQGEAEDGHLVLKNEGTSVHQPAAIDLRNFRPNEGQDTGCLLLEVHEQIHQ